MPSPKSEPTFSQPEYAKPKKQKTEYPFYTPNIDKYLSPQTQDLLEKYSNIPQDQQSQHVHKIRDQAWEISTYPCTGLGVWLMPHISYSPAYQTIIKKMKSGNTFLDIGCFLGGDLRRMVFDGAPSSNMYGIDIVSHWNVGFDMFRDRGRFKATFIEADILSDDPALVALNGKIDIISISAVLHQWDWDDQIAAAKKLVRLSKPGSLVVGHQIGLVESRRIMNKALQTWQWSHDPASFERLWNQTGTDTGTRWRTEAALHSFDEMGWDPKDQSWMDPDNRVLDFVVTRLE